MSWSQAIRLEATWLKLWRQGCESQVWDSALLGLTENPVVHDHGGEAHSGFQNVNFKDDVLGNMGAGIWEHPQWSVYVADYAPVLTHSIAKMVASMEARGFSWTNLNVVSKCEPRARGYYTTVDVRTTVDVQTTTIKPGVVDQTMALAPSSMTICAVFGATVFLVV